MSLLKDLGFDTGEVDIGDAEKKLASGGLPPEGVHHAILEGAGGIPNADGRGWKLVFKIVAGPGEGATVEEALWRPKGDDESKDKKTRNRVAIFAHRLGLLKKVQKGGKEVAVEVEGKNDFCDCLGAACFLDVKHEDEEYEKDGKKRTIKKAKLTFEGVLSPDDKRVKDVPKAKNLAAAQAGVGKPAGVGSGKPADSYADL